MCQFNVKRPSFCLSVSRKQLGTLASPSPNYICHDEHRRPPILCYFTIKPQNCCVRYALWLRAYALEARLREKEKR
jgi:hypothetical protein